MFYQAPKQSKIKFPDFSPANIALMFYLWNEY